MLRSARRFARRGDFAKLLPMEEQQDNVILFNIDRDGIALLQVNRPHVRNALNWAAQDRFAACVAAIAEDRHVRALIIAGTGDQAFVSGGDLHELSQNPDPAAGLRLNRVMSRALEGLRKLPFPVIAAINGDAFGGGCEIVTACDLRLAGEQARFGFAQVRNGLTTGWGGGERLVQLIGLSRACELLLSGRTFDAQEALAIGLLHRTVTGREDVICAALSWAQELTTLPAQAQRALKQLVYAAASLPSASVSSLEKSLFARQWASDDHLEALAAFGEKRKPVFNRQWDV